MRKGLAMGERDQQQEQFTQLARLGWAFSWRRDASQGRQQGDHVRVLDEQAPPKITPTASA
ncbi:hypothetical protein ACFHYQ_26200 [Sphaerimonospora cavernae]|uniref:Uncharacterized protein n=1 Tax=Sphaerimonospora cavernae TaxID=1740611 RepID=A0ABV6UC72_9ACTN